MHWTNYVHRWNEFCSAPSNRLRSRHGNRVLMPSISWHHSIRICNLYMIRKSHTHLNRRDGKGMDCCGGWSDGRRIRIDGLRKPRWVWVRVGGVCGKHERRYLVRTLQRELLTVWRVPTKSWPQTQVQNGLYPKERKVRHGWPLFDWVRLGPIGSDWLQTRFLLLFHCFILNQPSFFWMTPYALDCSQNQCGDYSWSWNIHIWF